MTKKIIISDNASEVLRELGNQAPGEYWSFKDIAWRCREWLARDALRSALRELRSLRYVEFSDRILYGKAKKPAGGYHYTVAGTRRIRRIYRDMFRELDSAYPYSRSGDYTMAKDAAP